MYYKLRGPNVATCSACATSTHAIGEAWRTIKMGDAQVMFAGGRRSDDRSHWHRRLLRDERA